MTDRLHTDKILQELEIEFSKMSARERAFILVKNYLETVLDKKEKGEEVPDGLSEAFWNWFYDPQDSEAKYEALKRLE